ncbi:transcription elongation factor subunit Spt4 [Staphylothermus hellenicus]|uniref:Transcription elongation factor Spt4 n=1 Tax=Staphylothermus hellenicus (strain DSM 12710 / JCM 10830 / BK20S6-10-b1 / P8) TaxID=591019 RepID=D7DAC2_STAHD|nr:transcription elongation factor subunit Spt4 [Staphylothermus hellenicus]ADI32718.1 DNA-directed RNA polymerase subunit E, RpoE2 [Staphylothermus hellenicus DSM 12710]
MPARRKPFKACRKCRALVDKNATECPHCGSRDLTEDWEGIIIVIDPENSEIAKILGFTKPGRYAIKVT